MDAVRISQEDPTYPAGLKACLGQSAPEAFWASGNLELLARKHKLAIFCSRSCPGSLIVKTYEYIKSLRERDVIAIGGFHSPVEQGCLKLLLRDSGSVIICPARSLDHMRTPAPWRELIDKVRLLLLSPFESRHRRVTAKLTEQRNEFVAALADEVFIAHASPNGKAEQLSSKIISWGKSLLTFDHLENANLLTLGAKGVAITRNIKAKMENPRKL